MDVTSIAFALTTGVVVGALFSLLDAPLPAPPTLAGVTGIFGLYVGFKLVEHLELSFDLAAILGL